MNSINTTDTMYYIFNDHLGSITTIANNKDSKMQKLSYDMWGKRSIANTDYTSYLFDRGFTGHEHLDMFGLINMNGRMYDPLLGRFLSPDNYVQGEGSQGFNRYSYCLNNPLKYTDPTGWEYDDVFDFDYEDGPGDNALNGWGQKDHFGPSKRKHSNDNDSWDDPDDGGSGYRDDYNDKNGTPNPADFPQYARYWIHGTIDNSGEFIQELPILSGEGTNGRVNYFVYANGRNLDDVAKNIPISVAFEITNHGTGITYSAINSMLFNTRDHTWMNETVSTNFKNNASISTTVKFYGPPNTIIDVAIVNYPNNPITPISSKLAKQIVNKYDWMGVTWANNSSIQWTGWAFWFK